MKGRTKVVRKAKKVLLQDDISNTFNQMSGADGPEPAIAMQKYDKYETYLSNCFSLLETLGKKIADKKLMSFGEDGKKFLLLNKPPKPDSKKKISKEQRIEYMMHKYDIYQISQHYVQLKESPYVSKLIIVYSNLKQYEEKIKSEKSNWIICSDEHSMVLFDEITDRDFLSECNSGDKDYVIYIHLAISVLYPNLSMLRELHSSPDIDVDKIVEVLMESIDDVQKHIPRCEKAFSIIKSNASMFKNNFSEYYKDYQQSGSKTMILENFIADVSKNAEGDPQLTQQFRKIIEFIKDNAQKSGMHSDPKMSKLVKTAMEQLGGE